jgi:hypothetical protein
MLTSGAVLVSRVPAAPSPLDYSLAVVPTRIPLGEPATAVLSCAANADSVEAITFDDSSLGLFLILLPRGNEAIQAFPNRVVAQAGPVDVHLQTAGRRQLRRGEVMKRELDLLHLWPRWILDVGSFEISYRLGPEPHPWVAGPATFEIESGPAAVPRLLELLEHPDMAVRARAAGLLHRMTAHVTGYSADGDPGERRAGIDRWRKWWRDEGSKIPWNFGSNAATFGAPSARPAQSAAPALGGLAYTRRPLQPREATALLAALGSWLENPNAGPSALRGKEHVADLDFEYPPDAGMLAVDGRLLKLFDLAVRQLPDHPAAAPLILATVAKIPDRQLIQSLALLQHAARSSSALRVPAAFAAGLLDALDPERVPVGANMR